MKFKHFSAVAIILAFSFVLLAMVLPVQNKTTVNDESVSSNIDSWYACERGNHQPACDALETVDAVDNPDALADWYACERGNHQSACDALETADAVNNPDALADWYACERGNHQSACETIGQNANTEDLS